MHQHRFSTAISVTAIALLLAACTDEGAADGASSEPPSAPVSPAAGTGPTASPTPPALPDGAPATRGPAAADCVNGWATPDAGSAAYRTPLRTIQRVADVAGRLAVVDIRSFDGPESPPSDKGYLLDVRRWYVKAYSKDDLSFQGRFLVEAREFGTGLVAVAPYDTNGFRSPDWVGFQFDSSDRRAHPYPRLPGRWAGVPYDFVTGGAGLEIPGLPEEVAGCLTGT